MKESSLISVKSQAFLRKVHISDQFTLQQIFSLKQLFCFSFWVNAAVLPVWYFNEKKKRSAVVEQVHLKNKKYLSNVIFVITEFYIFIQRFGLHSGPVTDCTFVGNVLSKSAPLRSMLIFKPDFPDICSTVQGSSMLASAHFSQAGCWVYFVI